MPLQLASHALRAPASAALLRLRPLPVLVAAKRNSGTDTDFAREMIGKREIVGYGWNGSPCYADRLDYPMPAIRFKEPTNEICVLREKELCDWKKLTIDEKKALYRYSFCQTFAEMKAPTGEWKLALGVGIWACVLGLLMTYSFWSSLYGPMPVTFDEDHRRAQLKRMLGLQVNPIEGVSSKWDYENKRWKK